MAVTITTTGSTFAPVVARASGSSATVTWSCPGFADQVSLTPSFSFGSAATRTVTMTVTGGGGDADITLFNCGYDNNFDVGDFMPPSSLAKSPQAISGIGNINSLVGLVYLLADDTALAGALDLTGMASLQFIQLAHTNVTGLTLAGCTSLIRLQIEGANVSSLNLNPVAGNLKDLRAAIQQGDLLAFTALSGSMTQLYHYCVRDQVVTGCLPLSQLPAIKEYWVWNCELSGAMSGAGSTTLVDIRAHGNNLDSIDLTGCTALAQVRLNGNLLTSVTLTGCTALNYCQLDFNLLTSSVVDQVLATVNGFGTSNGELDLTINTAPSATGTAHQTALTGRGWTVTVDSPASGAITVVQSSSSSTTFASPVGAGNSVVFCVDVSNSTGAAISTSNLLFDNKPARRVVLLQEKLVQSATRACYHAIYLIPHCSDGTASAYNLTQTGGATRATRVIEVSGLGLNPVSDRQAHNSATSGTAVTSGTTLTTRTSPEFVIGTSMIFSASGAGPGGAWTMLANGTLGWIGYQIPAATGTFSWAQTASGSNPWTCGIVTIAAEIPSESTTIGWGVRL